MKNFLIAVVLIFITLHETNSQNFNFNFFSSGRRVCLTSAQADLMNHTIKVMILDSVNNNNEPVYIYRRQPGSVDWNLVADALPAGTGHWIDDNVAYGDIWEYQVKRMNTWNFQSQSYDATGYTLGVLGGDNADYKGRIILLVSSDIPTQLSTKYFRLKKELTADGWYVLELIVNRATGWDSGDEVVIIRNQIMEIYNNVPENDKPAALFILGHVPLPRSGSTEVTAPDMHDQNKGARGCDAYYADMDGIFTDTATYNPGGLSTPLAINLPGDYKWDQDFFPSDIEMAFGRVDFAGLTEVTTSEMEMIENYLDRLSFYKNVLPGYEMSRKSGFYYGYDNSNDGSYRTLPGISGPENVIQNFAGVNHNQWVRENGPFSIYMQNQSVPSISDWQTFGMDATVFSSDQSYWGFGDVPQPGGVYSRIRTLLGLNTRCLVTLWTTTGINIFHQACTGQALGIAMKQIMNHNQANQYIEKAPQQYDTQDWWNRTHFAFFGDPTLNLYQVSPVSELKIRESQGVALLEWDASPDDDVTGYHVYESSTELGIFQRITDQLVEETEFILPAYTQGDWYMIKAVKPVVTGCGSFLHTSMGASIQGDFALETNEKTVENSLTCFPNPCSDFLELYSDHDIEKIEVMSVSGQLLMSYRVEKVKKALLNLSALAGGYYFMRVTCVAKPDQTLPFVKIGSY